MVIPAIVSVAALLFATEHAPPLLASLIATTPPLEDAVIEQSVNPARGVTVGVAGTVKLGLNMTMIALPAASAPTDEVVKPTVHVAVESADCGEPANVTAVTGVETVTVPLAALAADQLL